MKKSVFGLSVFLLFGASFCNSADYETTNSTNSVGASTLFVIPNTNPGDILGSLLINQRSAAAETIKLYDSSGTATGLIGTITLSTGTAAANSGNEYVYNLRLSSAATITKSAGSADVTIIWKNVR